jgi:hypothetical protein
MAQQPKAVFVDAISGQHISSDPQSLLQQRQLTFSKDYGWQYDVWVEDSLKYALSGAHSRSATVSNWAMPQPSILAFPPVDHTFSSWTHHIASSMSDWSAGACVGLCVT